MAQVASVPDFGYDADELVRHASRSIREAECFSDPFPHIFFRNIFPEEFYRDVLSSFPAESSFDRLNKEGTRFALRIYGDHVDRIEPEVRSVWQAVSSILTSPEVEEAVRDRLAEGMEIRRKGDRVVSADRIRTVAKPVVYKDNDGYSIKPHPDARKKIITMQIYCPPDEKQIDLGTTLYRASAKGLLNPGSYFLEPVKTFPFIPNAGYAFVVLKSYHSLSRMSWHGRPAIKVPIERPRMSILNTYYASEELGF